MRPKKDLTLAAVIGSNLKILREKHFHGHGRMKEMCKAVGVTPQTWNKWEAGTIVPSELNLRKLARLFDVTVAELRGDDIGKNAPATTTRAREGVIIPGGLPERYAAAVARLVRLAPRATAYYQTDVEFENRIVLLEGIVDEFEGRLSEEGMNADVG